MALEDPGPSSATSSRQQSVSKSGKIVVALYNYIRKDGADLSFRKGDRLLILKENDNDWLLARHIVTTEEGFIPKIFVAAENSDEVQDWFFGSLSRREAEKLLLESKKERGTFLIRKSRQPMAVPGAYALSIKDWNVNLGNVVVHYRIRSLDNGGVFITTRDTFDTLLDLVHFYTDNANGLCFKLTSPCEKTEPHMWDLSPDTRDRWEIDPQEFTILKKIGKGKFGNVFYGKWRDSKEVAIKTLKKNAIMSTEAFLQEAAIMKRLRHDNIVSLYAVCSIREPIYIVTEYMRNGSLQHYLKSDGGKQLKLPHLVDFAAQIANAMVYLEKKQLVHRDLATRNILVGDHYNVKVADFGLAKVVGDYEYTSRKGSKFPVKWTAPEAIFQGKFSVKSDVWSFGIVLMEIFTYGATPYPGMNNREVADVVKRGYRMPKPTKHECPKTIYATMLECWDSNPNARPTFKYLFTRFDNFGVFIDKVYREAEEV